jgi:hypothetical protein
MDKLRFGKEIGCNLNKIKFGLILPKNPYVIWYGDRMIYAWIS